MYLEFFLSAIIIVTTGVFLTRSADLIAQKTGLGRLWIGSIFLAGATSLPEFSVDVSALWQGLPEVAIGGLLGSNLFNLMILGVLDLSHHSRGRFLSPQSRMHALSGVMGILMIGIVTLSIVVGAKGNFYFMSFGSLVLILAYVLGIRLIYHDQKFLLQTKSESENKEAGQGGQNSLYKAIIIYISMAIVIFIAGPFLANSAGKIASHTGLGQGFVGTTFVAISTSLPELVTTFTALKLKAFDLALGNLFGSNAFNLLILAILDGVSHKPLFSEVSSVHLVTCLATIIITSVAILGQLYHIESRKKFLEPDAWLIVFLSIGALVLVYTLS